MSQWIQYWLNPLLADTRFNDNRTVILLTFDETESRSPTAAEYDIAAC